MKLKALPQDFVVREAFDFVHAPRGPYFVHVLRKEKLDTLQAIGIVAKLASVGREDIAFAGLKDRQGRTEQWISIRGRRLDYEDVGLQVRFVGRAAMPVTSKQSRGNHFRIVLRDLGLVDIDRLRQGVAALQHSGVANYFDDQRFGGLRHGQGFVMEAVLARRYEQALHQMLARPSRVAVGGDVKLKQILQRHWGDWPTCARIARGPTYRAVFGQLVEHPGDFRGALAALPVRQKLIHAFAYQSHLWNQAVSRFLEELLPRRNRIWLPAITGRLLTWRDLLDTELAHMTQLATPLPGPGMTEIAPAFRAVLDRVLAHARLSPLAFTADVIPGMALRAEPRALVVVPRELRAGAVVDDDLTPGRYKVALSFTLPRGAYATLVVKRLFQSGAVNDAGLPHARGRSPRHGSPRHHQQP